MSKAAQAGDFLADTRGSVCRQYVRCSKSNCKCARGDLHGPYFYLFRREGRKLRKRYVRRSDVAAVREQCERARAAAREKREYQKLLERDIFRDTLSKALMWM